MGSPETPSPHLYSQGLQLKLYQGFIFSIPILFSIILFLLFYLFYLKRRPSTISSPQPTLSGSSSDQSTPIFPPSTTEKGLNGNLKEKLRVILFNEDQRIRDPQCCVCLGEFEVKEEVHQVPSCKHVFHMHCISHWLRSNSTCPLCRCSIYTCTTKHTHLPHPRLPVGPYLF